MKTINISSLARISLQLNIDYFTLTLASILIAGIVIVILVIALLYRRRSRPKSGFHIPDHLPMLMTYPHSGEASPTTTVLETLRRDLEETSAAHLSGLLTRKDFEERIEEIRKILDDLRQFSDATSKHKKCSNCGTEIAKEAQYCDKCGTKQE